MVNMKIFAPILTSLLLALFLFNIALIPAQANILKGGKSNEIQGNIDNIAANTGYSTENSLESILGTVIRVLLAIIGSIFIFFLFLAGQSWMRAGGNEEQIKNAKKRITSLVIGLIIIIAAYTASYWLVDIFTGSRVNLVE